MLSLAPASLAFAPVAMPAPAAAARASVKMETIADLEALAKECNPVIGFWDPLNLMSADYTPWGQEATIGFFRHAEIKHGRVAMAAFVGFIAASNGIHFPWSTSLDGTTYETIASAGGPAAQWDALPTNAKLQIFGFVGGLELASESTAALAASGQKHYMRGGVPGKFPSLKAIDFPHSVPFDLFDPFGLSKNASPEKKAKGLVAEINNGRLAQLGIMAFVAEARVPGAVPALNGLITPYSGECMAPFTSADALPFIDVMSQWNAPY